jgi:hypothetical protein
LYGRRAIAAHDSSGKLTITSEQIAEHKSGGKRIPSGLFEHPEGVHVAVVLFSNAHTVSIFNRIGTERGYGPSDVSILRFGTTYDPDPNSSEPLLFAYVVGDRPMGEQETFAEGLELFINPWAHTKLLPDALPAINYIELLDDGRFVSKMRAGVLHPYSSKTMIFKGVHAESFARLQQLRILRLAPTLPDKES